MGKVWRGACIAAAVVVVAYTLAYIADAVRGPTSEQRVVADELRMQRKPAGNNAWAVLWSGDFDVSDGEAARFYAEDLRRFPSWVHDAPRPTAASKEWPRFELAAARDAKPLIPMTPDDSEVLCRLTTLHCLEQVREDRVAVRNALDRHARRLARVESLRVYDQLWSDVPATQLTPMPAVAHIANLWTTVAALRFVEGDRELGLTTACQGALTMRSMHAQSNTLVGSMILDSGFRRSAHLVAEMMSELSDNEMLPGVCREAFAEPTLADVDYRPLAANEWDFARSEDDGWPKAPWHPDRPAATDVGIYAALGSKQASEAMLADLPFDPAAHLGARPDALQRLAHPFAASAMATFANEYQRYIDRGADYVATIRMVRVLLWLRDHPSSEAIASRLAAVPEALGLPLGRAVVIGCEGRCLDLRERVTVGHAAWPVRPSPPERAAKPMYCPRPLEASLSPKV